MQYFSMKIHKSCYNVYKYSPLIFSCIIFAVLKMLVQNNNEVIKTKTVTTWNAKNRPDISVDGWL